MIESIRKVFGNMSTHKQVKHSIIKSYVRHYIPFVKTHNVVVEGYDNAMRGYMIKKTFFQYYVEGDIVNSHGRSARYTSNWFYLGNPNFGLF